MNWGKTTSIISILFLSSCTNYWVEFSPDSYTPKLASDTYIPKNPLPKIADLLEPILPDPKEEQNLASLIDIALQNQPHTQETWAIAKQAAANWAVTRASYYPGIYLGANATKLHNSFGSLNNGPLTGSSLSQDINTQSSWGFQATLAYTIYDFGQRNAKTKKAMRALQAANWSHNEAIQKLMQKVSDRYYNYLYEKANLEALEVDLKDAQIAFQSATRKLQTGVADVAEMLQAKTRYLQQKLRVVAQNKIVENQYFALLNDLGLPSDAKIALSKLPEEVNLKNLEINPKDLLEIAKMSRPDFASAKADVLKQQANVDLAKSERYPVLNTTLSGGKQYYKDAGNSNNYSIQFNFTVPFFTGFFFTNQIRKAEDSLLQAKAKLRSVGNQITQDVMKYINNFESSKESVALAKDYLQSALEEFHSILRNYEQGTNNIVDLVSSQSAVADARSQYIKMKKDLFTSLTDLTYAIGSLTRDDYQTQEFQMSDSYEN